MAVHRYAETALLRDRLNIDSDERDLALGQVLDAASRWVDNQTRRRFYATTETRYYTARWRYPHSDSHGMGGDFPWGNPERPGGGGFAGQHIAIDDFMSVSAVATDDDGDGVYETTWTVGTDYWLGPRNAVVDGKPYRSVNRNQVTGRYVFPPYENGIQVVGSAGFSAAVPDPIRDLTLTVAEIMARPFLDMSIPGVQTYKFGDQLSLSMKTEDLPPLAKLTLDQYSDPVFLR